MPALPHLLIEQLTYLLFLKMADERGARVPKDCEMTQVGKWVSENVRNFTLTIPSLPVKVPP